MTKKFSAKHVKIVAFSLLSGNSSCHKVRSSRQCVGRFPLGLDDLTLWHDELPDNGENATIFTCFAEQIVEGWTRMKFGVGREKIGSGEEGRGARDTFS